MSTKTGLKLKAVRASIEHWRRMRAMPHAERMTERETPAGVHCPLCAVYAAKGFPPCFDCPVYEKTGRRSCEGTNWLAAKDAFFRPHDEAWQNEADVMISFLEGIAADLQSEEGGRA